MQVNCLIFNTQTLDKNILHCLFSSQNGEVGASRPSGKRLSFGDKCPKFESFVAQHLNLLSAI